MSYCHSSGFLVKCHGRKGRSPGEASRRDVGGTVQPLGRLELALLRLLQSCPTFVCCLIFVVAKMQNIYTCLLSLCVFVFLKILAAYILFSEFTNFTHVYSSNSDMFLSNLNFPSGQSACATSDCYMSS